MLSVSSAQTIIKLVVCTLHNINIFHAWIPLRYCKLYCGKHGALKLAVEFCNIHSDTETD